MNREKFIDLLGQTDRQGLYRALYLAAPEAFDAPIGSWAAFGARVPPAVGALCGGIPAEPPTPIAELLTERAFFPGEPWGEVNVIVNARYCPAFLHRLEFIKLVYVFRGSCRFYLDGRWHPMAAGNVCLVAPGVEQAVFSCHDEDIVLNLLLRKSTFAASFGDLLGGDGGGAIADFFWKMLYHKPGGEALLITGRPEVLIEEAVMELYEEALLQPVKSCLVMKSLMLSIMAYLMRGDERALVPLKGPGGGKPYPLARYLYFMKSNLADVSLAALAREFHLSEGYLSRYFAHETGSTFRHLLMEMKLKRAAELLVKTDCSIGKLTASLGYSDQSSFFRSFKALYGMPPMVYRKKKRRAEFIRTV